MANKKISELNSATTPLAGTEEIAIVQGVETKKVAVSELQTPIQDTGNIITFDKNRMFNTSSSPTSLNITNDLTGAKLGVVQKIYHNHTSEPTYPAGWVNISPVEYVPSELNIIYAEWCSGSRVEYWITQEN